MPRDMFGDIVEPSIKVGSQKWYTIPLSIVVHTVIIAALIIIPLMAFDALPTPPAIAVPPTPSAATAAPASISFLSLLSMP